MTLSQGGTKTVPSRENEEIAVYRAAPGVYLDDDDVLGQRVLTILGRDPGTIWSSQSRPWSWWEVRQTVGGRCSSEHFRRIVDELLSDGMILEVWEAMPDRRQPRHRLVLADRWHEYFWERLIKVRGRAELIASIGLHIEPVMYVESTDAV